MLSIIMMKYRHGINKIVVLSQLFCMKRHDKAVISAAWYHFRTEINNNVTVKMTVLFIQ